MLEGKFENLRVKAILIDLDGTIVDIGEPLIEAARQTASALGLREETCQKNLLGMSLNDSV
jgi:phosphoglycolate phosphatase-like HAD superfamily hydrolase